ncbi:MAG: bacteriophage T4 gp5 trimerization domain-containing protein [bacterium]
MSTNNSDIDIRGKMFLGRIVSDDHSKYYDYKRQGRYLVHIPDLMPGISEDEGIYCKNHVHNWRITSSNNGEYGQYFPLHPGTYVIVKFFENDLSTGFIDKVLSDFKEDRNVEAQDCIDPVPALTDRDEQYIIFKTPKKWNIFYVNEETENEPNTIYLVYNRDDNPNRRTVFRINESGLHFWTRDNNRVRIATDDNKQIDGDKTSYVKGSKQENIDTDKDFHVKGNETTKTDGNKDSNVGGNLTLEVEGNVDISVSGTVNVFSASNINIDGSAVNINCGIASSTSAATPKEKVEVKDLGPEETSEYETGVGDTCDDATDNYNVGPRSENEKMVE